MIVNGDAKALEIVCAAFLSQDKVLIEELRNGVDLHSVNQKEWGLPEGKLGRLIAKIGNFRILYGGTEYSFASDPDFTQVSTSVKYWKTFIDNYYSKYKGISQWHEKLIQTVTRTGELLMPTGRGYTYSKTVYGDWPVTQIKNFPVQGCGSDIMAVIRVAFYKRFKERKFRGVVIATVHDSIVCDVPDDEVGEVVKLFHEVFDLGPKLFEQWFGVPFNLPLQVEVSIGPNLADLKEIN